VFEVIVVRDAYLLAFEGRSEKKACGEDLLVLL